MVSGGDGLMIVVMFSGWAVAAVLWLRLQSWRALARHACRVVQQIPSLPPKDTLA